MSNSVKIASESTEIVNGRSGWKGETVLSIKNGCAYQISTFKGARGYIATTAQAGTHGTSGPFKTFKFRMFTDPNYKLYTSEAKRATSKSVRETHSTGLAAFKEKLQAGEIATQLPTE